MQLRGKKVTVLGLGRSGLGAARLLLAEGAIPFVSESRDDASLKEYKEELERLGAAYEAGGHSEAAFRDASMIIVSPGVPAALEPLQSARARGIPVIGELEFASRFCQSVMLAVTGTNGKTTTTELLRHLIAACGHSVALAGNNDMPLSVAVLQRPVPEYIVAEVSSYQLETAQEFHPKIAAVLNLTPDHLGRHGSMEQYAREKARIFARQGCGDIAVLNEDDPWAAEMTVPEEVRVLAFSIEHRVLDGLWADGEVIRRRGTMAAGLSDNPLPGRHNLSNVLAALTMMRAGAFDWERTIAGLRSFRGVEHRIELTAAIAGAEYYNDSKSTNIDSLRVALESFARPIVLIAGGRGKGADYRVLRDVFQAHVKAMITLGEDAPKLEEAFGDLAPFERASNMMDSVELAKAAAAPGDVVLLSPACASFDMYRNFEERGRDFKACVQRLRKDLDQ